MPRKTRQVDIGGVGVGGGSPVVVQSMTNTDTADPAATALQVKALADAGSELVRVTVNNKHAAAAVPELFERLADLGCTVPIVGDFHYNGHILLRDFPRAAALLSKYRINPGNVGTSRRDENFQSIVRIAIENGKAIRIGVNWGSLDQRLLTQMMDENGRREHPKDAGGRAARLHRRERDAFGRPGGGDGAGWGPDRAECESVGGARPDPRVPPAGAAHGVSAAPGSHRGGDGFQGRRGRPPPRSRHSCSTGSATRFACPSRRGPEATAPRRFGWRSRSCSRSRSAASSRR